MGPKTLVEILEQIQEAREELMYWIGCNKEKFDEITLKTMDVNMQNLINSIEDAMS